VDLNPGDTISIYPENRPEDVQKLIGWMDWGAEADMSIDWHKSRLPQNLYSAHSLTLRDLLTRHLDITSVPKRAFLKRISYFTSEPAHKERLLEFTSPDYVDDYYDYTTRPRRTMLEVLQEFTSVKIPAGRALDTFPLIRGREFSIANGGFSTSHPTDPAKRRIEIVVALVRYKTILRKERRGLCSRYLEDMLPDGATITVLHKKTLTPTHGAEMARRPLVGIATGTGLAPIRSLIWERATHSDAAPMHLFFGFRNRQSDCHFRDEWVAIPNLVLHPAESRPSGSSERAYVQDLLVREAETVADVIRRDAIFFVCGGSHKMARAVRDAVMQVAEKELGAKSEEEQERVFEGLEWVQEIW
jgi:sulfite reductase alpha subunit-like flavoprotein